jgi:FAD dependent oxidoreductase TIGR03364
MPSPALFDDAVVGAGIIGLAHAYHLARRGRRVVVFERHERAMSASVRNFGMIWPIGQPFGRMRTLALNSRRHWLEILAASGLWHDCNGSLHLAYEEDEAQVLREYARQSQDAGQPVELLSPSDVANRAKGVVPNRLQVGLLSPLELCVDPREVVAKLPRWLADHHGVEFRFGKAVTAVDPPSVRTSDGESSARRIWVCSGDEFGLLFPERLQKSGLVRCKLQMMRSQAYGDRWRIGPSLAAGLTLRHYGSFAACPTLPVVKERVKRETPWFDQFGIHVLVSQNGLGELSLGDSHEYGAQVEPFDKAQVDGWILDYLRTFLDAPALEINARWHGIYAKHPTEPFIIDRPMAGVTVTTGLGGAGMTLSFGLADELVSAELGETDR